MANAEAVAGIAANQDNVIWRFSTAPGRAAAVDPGEAEPLLDHLRQRGESLSHVLLTHHHADHVGGVEVLKRAFPSLRVIGAAADACRLPPLDLAVSEGDGLALGERTARVMAVPGHTSGHLAFVVGEWLFPGDVLFRCGCGRLFEGTAEQMWHSLQRLSSLPDATLIFPGHEYTLANLAFALHWEPDRVELLEAREETRRLRREGRWTMPVPLERERRLNPFLRCADPEFAARLGMERLSPVERFATLRRLRNDFTG
ncbi:MAG: hydroxyacylglutathione hydrolase [Magnetococcales bacterium]|nr:hydroxyacylglutathione hydrolase [Magnetococcales bacterium]